ncbi:MAG: sigma-70 family RNA polymerase sigma factor [Alphaproteobacteria bacterium]|nr:sigma-70 family RNA polymerase sigma factor [Alphaproteobacteria bacterium]
MESTARGCRQAFACLMERHLRSMTALAQRVTGNASDADEVAQEAFLRLWRYAPRWDADGPAMVRTWLGRVVVNLCLDRLRQRRWAPLEEAGELVDTAPGGFEARHQEDRRRLVQEMLLQLPLRQRTAVVLSYFQDHSGAEIAQVMSLSIGAVESLLVRARRTLRKNFKKQGLLWGEDV